MPPPRGSRRVFGQAMGKSKSSKSRYQQQFGGGSKAPAPSNTSSDDAALVAARRQARQQKVEQIDTQFGFETFAFQNSNDGESRQSRERRGWLFNVLPTTVGPQKKVAFSIENRMFSDFFLGNFSLTVKH